MRKKRRSKVRHPPLPPSSFHFLPASFFPFSTLFPGKLFLGKRKIRKEERGKGGRLTRGCTVKKINTKVQVGRKKGGACLGRSCCNCRRYRRATERKKKSDTSWGRSEKINHVKRLSLFFTFKDKDAAAAFLYREKWWTLDRPFLVCLSPKETRRSHPSISQTPFPIPPPPPIISLSNLGCTKGQFLFFRPNLKIALPLLDAGFSFERGNFKISVEASALCARASSNKTSEKKSTNSVFHKS